MPWDFLMGFSVENRVTHGLIVGGTRVDDKCDQKKFKAHQNCFSKGSQFLFFAAKGGQSGVDPSV